MRGGYVVRVTPDDVGSRVSLRVRLDPAPTSGPMHTDVLGTLESWSDGLLRVRRRDETVVEVLEELLVAGKPLPPPR